MRVGEEMDDVKEKKINRRAEQTRESSEKKHQIQRRFRRTIENRPLDMEIGLLKPVMISLARLSLCLGPADIVGGFAGTTEPFEQ
jgi:hypothetical protein